MIICPKCKSQKNVISEAPYWMHRKEDTVKIGSRCLDCEIDFETTHKIGPAETVEIIEDDYPLSA